MINEVKMYNIKCDRCGAISTEGDEISGWDNAGFAIDCAIDSDWVEMGSKHYCPNCYEYNYDDELVIKP